MLNPCSILTAYTTPSPYHIYDGVQDNKKVVSVDEIVVHGICVK